MLLYFYSLSFKLHRLFWFRRNIDCLISVNDSESSAFQLWLGDLQGGSLAWPAWSESSSSHYHWKQSPDLVFLNIEKRSKNRNCRLRLQFVNSLKCECLLLNLSDDYFKTMSPIELSHMGYQEELKAQLHSWSYLKLLLLITSNSLDVTWNQKWNFSQRSQD